MWLDRLSTHATPNPSPPGRTSFQNVRRSSQLPVHPRPGYSPRSSSLNVGRPNGSSASFNSPRLNANGSTLRQELTPAPDLTDPLAVLEQIVGKSLRQDEKEGAPSEDEAAKPQDLVQDINFDDLSLEEFVNRRSQSPVPKQNVDQCE